MEGILEGMNMMLQQMTLDSHVREAQREEREAQREAQREEREAQREAREAQRAEDLRSVLASILQAVRPQPTLPSASPPLSFTSQNNSPVSSRSNHRSHHSPTNLLKLRTAFTTAAESGDNIDLSGFSPPYQLSDLMRLGVLHAHRAAGRGCVGESKDFEIDIDSDGLTTMLLPPTSSKAGMSFFILLSKSQDVLKEAHTYHSVRHCIAYPLNSVPDGMALKIDKAQVSTSGDADGKPIMLHASLSTISAMSIKNFTDKITSWSGMCACLISAAGESSDCESLFEDEIISFAEEEGALWGDQEGDESGGSGDVTETLLKEVSHKLSSEVPAGGSPGAFLPEKPAAQT